MSTRRQLQLIKDDATAAIHLNMKGNDYRFELVPFEKFNEESKLRCQNYKSY